MTFLRWVRRNWCFAIVYYAFSLSCLLLGYAAGGLLYWTGWPDVICLVLWFTLATRLLYTAYRDIPDHLS